MFNEENVNEANATGTETTTSTQQAPPPAETLAEGPGEAEKEQDPPVVAKEEKEEDAGPKPDDMVKCTACNTASKWGADGLCNVCGAQRSHQV